MEPVIDRRNRMRWVLPLLCLLAGACDDSPTGGSRTIRLLQPLTMTWPGQDSGVPYSGGYAEFRARSELRVVWHFRIDVVPRPPDRRPAYVTQFDNQDRIFFTWSGIANSGSGEFAPGDSCVAQVTYSQLDPEDAERARFVFTIAR
jgi:hypothetical protein